MRADLQSTTSPVSASGRIEAACQNAEAIGSEMRQDERLENLSLPLDVVTHHKCASTWLNVYLNELCKRNAIDYFAALHSFPELTKAYDVGLFLNSEYKFVSNKLGGGIHIIRNPLDIIVSAYHSHKKTHPLDGWPQLAAQRNALRSSDEKDGYILTMAFLERDDFYDGAVGPLYALRHWDFDDDRFCTLRMEDIVDDPSVVLWPLIRARVGPDATPNDDLSFRFENWTGRKVGDIDETSHYRSGRPDQWRHELPEAVIAYVRAHYAPLLQRFYSHCLTAR